MHKPVQRIERERAILVGAKAEINFIVVGDKVWEVRAVRRKPSPTAQARSFSL